VCRSEFLLWLVGTMLDKQRGAWWKSLCPMELHASTTSEGRAWNAVLQLCVWKMPFVVCWFVTHLYIWFKIYIVQTNKMPDFHHNFGIVYQLDFLSAFTVRFPRKFSAYMSRVGIHMKLSLAPYGPGTIPLPPYPFISPLTTFYSVF